MTKNSKRTPSNATFHSIGVLYGTPSVLVSAVQDGPDVLVRESPTGESACYPNAPWNRRVPLAEFLSWPFHHNWITPMRKSEVELALRGQLFNRPDMEWPHVYTCYHNAGGLSGRPIYDNLRYVAYYWEIRDGVVI